MNIIKNVYNDLTRKSLDDLILKPYKKLLNLLNVYEAPFNGKILKILS